MGSGEIADNAIVIGKVLPEIFARMQTFNVAIRLVWADNSVSNFNGVLIGDFTKIDEQQFSVDHKAPYSVLPGVTVPETQKMHIRYIKAPDNQILGYQVRLLATEEI